MLLLSPAALWSASALPFRLLLRQQPLRVRLNHAQQMGLRRVLEVACVCEPACGTQGTQGVSAAAHVVKTRAPATNSPAPSQALIHARQRSLVQLRVQRVRHGLLLVPRQKRVVCARKLCDEASVLLYQLPLPGAAEVARACFQLVPQVTACCCCCWW
jgi:hypothetical protein